MLTKIPVCYFYSLLYGCSVSKMKGKGRKRKKIVGTAGWRRIRKKGRREGEMKG